MQPVVSDEQFAELSEEDYKKLIHKQRARKKRSWEERSAGNGKSYVVFKGTRTGIFEKLEGPGGAERAIYGYKGARCKSYPSF